MTRTSSEPIPTRRILFASCTAIVEESSQRWIVETAMGGVEKRIEGERVRNAFDGKAFYFWCRKESEGYGVD
jgi:hypothetical protein